MEAIHAQDWDIFELFLPVSDATIVSTKEVEIKDRKKFNRSYPRCDALFI